MSNVADVEQNHPSVRLPKRAHDSLCLAQKLEKLSVVCIQKGYLNFTIDSVREDTAGYHVYPYWGRNYQGAVLVLDSAALAVASKPFMNVPQIPFSDYQDWSARALSQLENHGYPFADISLINTDLQSDTIGFLHIEPHQLVRYDSIIIRGDAKISPRFLRPYLNWWKKRPYNESSVSQVSQWLQQLPYVQIESEPGVEFVGDRAFLYLFLKKRRVNQFDGYIGLVPVSANDQRVMITGEVNLNFHNLFTIGESLSLKWQAPERHSQYLSILADFPCLFATPLGVSGSFLLDKKDTTYLNMRYGAALQYSFAGPNTLQTYFSYGTSSLLGRVPSSLAVADSASLDYRKAMYGVKLVGDFLDDPLSPRRGVCGGLDFSAGTRTILKNAKADPSCYDGIVMKSVYYQFEGYLFGYVPIGRRWGWVAGAQAATSFGGSPLLNDLYRIGGTKTLQGFDEYSIYASSYAILNTEFRFWFAARSYLNLFFNGAWVERRMTEHYDSDFPFGFGLGATFHTKAGNLYLSYALGQQKNCPLSFKTGKIHFGLDVRF